MWERLITLLTQVLSRLGNQGVSSRPATFGQTGFHIGHTADKLSPFRQQEGTLLDRVRDCQCQISNGGVMYNHPDSHPSTCG